jgi:hypothetical protein
MKQKWRFYNFENTEGFPVLVLVLVLAMVYGTNYLFLFFEK